jgi:FtsZ-binding cell division protein ZapB
MAKKSKAKAQKDSAPTPDKKRRADMRLEGTTEDEPSTPCSSPPLRVAAKPLDFEDEDDDEDSEGPDEEVTLSKSRYVALLDTIERLQLEMADLQAANRRLCQEVEHTRNERDSFQMGAHSMGAHWKEFAASQSNPSSPAGQRRSVREATRKSRPRSASESFVGMVPGRSLLDREKSFLHGDSELW